MAWRCRFLTARRSQRGHAIASAAPDTLLDFHTGRDLGTTREGAHLRVDDDVLHPGLQGFHRSVRHLVAHVSSVVRVPIHTDFDTRQRSVVLYFTSEALNLEGRDHVGPLVDGEVVFIENDRRFLRGKLARVVDDAPEDRRRHDRLRRLADAGFGERVLVPAPFHRLFYQECRLVEDLDS